MAINPIQSGIAGPAPNDNWNIQFPSNVTTGDLIIVKVWAGMKSDNFIQSLSDDQGNTYALDVHTSIQDGTGSGHDWVGVWIYRSVVGSGGNRPIVSVQFNIPGGVGGGSQTLLAGVSIAEYPTAVGSPPLDVISFGTDDGTGGIQPATGSVATSYANEISISLGCTENATALTPGSGWTSRDTWTASPSFVALGMDQTIPASGVPFSATMSGAVGNEWAIALASYRILSATNYVDKIPLGMSSLISESTIAEFDPILSIGVAAGDVGSGSGSYTSQSVLGVIQAFSYILQESYVASAGIAQSYRLAPLPTVAYTYPAVMSLSQAVACSVLYSLAGASQQGIISSYLSTGTVSTSGSSSIGSLLGVLTQSQRAFIDNVALGVALSLVEDSGKAIVDALNISGVLGVNTIPQYRASSLESLGTTLLATPQIAGNVSSLASLAAVLSIQADTGNKALEAVLGLIIGSALVAKSGGVSTSGTISLQDIYMFFDSLPGGLLPGLATVFAQLVYRGAVSDASPGVSVSSKLAGNAEVSDI